MIADPEWMHPVIRPLTWGDLDRVMEIELAAYPFPWSRGIFSDCLRVGYECLGLQVGGQLIGYSIQTEAAGEAHLLNLCIAPDWQRRGMGALLLENVIRTAQASGCQCVFLEVRPSNRAGIALYASRGFAVVGIRRGYYSAGPAAGESSTGTPAKRREDAIVMRLDLEAAA